MKRSARGVRGEPNPEALRRTGKALNLLLPPDEHAAAARDAEARQMSLSAHVRDLLGRWRQRRGVVRDEAR
jgi:predicted HicB family RNase H-like nuclease